MKLLTWILAATMSLMPLYAEYEVWNNKDGKSVELDLLEVTGEGDLKSGVFKMKDGRKVTIKKTDLNEDSAKRIDEWKAPVVKELSVREPSAFHEMLGDDLVILDGRRLKKHTPTAEPTKYYIFYYTASCCPPCRAFTPKLVDFYNKNKKGNDQFEIVLISQDRDKDAMEEYAKEYKMSWPQLKHSKVEDFEKKFAHGVNGIPAVVICDLQGKIVPGNGRDLDSLEKLIK